MIWFLRTRVNSRTKQGLSYKVYLHFLFMVKQVWVAKSPSSTFDRILFLQLWIHIIRRQQQWDFRWGEWLQWISRGPRKTARILRPAPASNPHCDLSAPRKHQCTSADCRPTTSRHSRNTAEPQPVCDSRRNTARPSVPVTSNGHCCAKMCLTATGLWPHPDSPVSSSLLCLHRDHQPVIRNAHGHTGDQLHVTELWTDSWAKLHASYLLYIVVRH